MEWRREKEENRAERLTLLRFLLPRKHRRGLVPLEAIPNSRERLYRCLRMVTGLSDGDTTDPPDSATHGLGR